MRIFFSVGEPSGDLHGANLIKDLKKHNPQIETVGFGGPKMSDAGCNLLFDLTSLAVMGLWNVLLNVRKFFALLDDADKYFEENQVDAVVLIDYPGFNWWIARKAKKHNIKVFYYGVPQMWAWLPWRVRKLRRLVDHVLCKLPFEVPWFESRGCKATFVGHPYFDELVRFQYDQAFIDQHKNKSGGRKRLVLLPGSRTQEVHRNLPWLLQSAAQVSSQQPDRVDGDRVDGDTHISIACFDRVDGDTHISIACFKESQAEFARQLLKESKLTADVFVGRTPELISSADACIACSGSVSLELLYHRKPTVIVYRVSAMVMLLQYILIRTRFITLVNMLGLKQIEKSAIPKYDPNDVNSDVPMPEYLRWRNCSAEVAVWINRWFNDPESYRSRVQQLNELAGQFAHEGASSIAARFVLKRLDENVAGENGGPVISGSVRNVKSNVGSKAA